MRSLNTVGNSIDDINGSMGKDCLLKPTVLITPTAVLKLTHPTPSPVIILSGSLEYLAEQMKVSWNSSFQQPPH